MMLRVAIVDDDASHCRALSRLLRAHDIASAAFASAEEFLERHGQADVDSVVLDLELGGMSGFDLQDRLAAGRPAPPVVFLTAHGEPEAITRAAQAGCAHILKTEPGTALIAAIRRAAAGLSPFPKG